MHLLYAGRGNLPDLHGEILTYDEIQRVCRCMTTLGIKKIKLTGGEPLTRKNSAALVRMLKELPGIEKVTLTTNGVLLGEQISELAEAGIDNINISLDTLNEEAFGKITRREGLPKVLESMKEALKYPQIGLKINCVPVIDDPQNLGGSRQDCERPSDPCALYRDDADRIRQRVPFPGRR